MSILDVLRTAAEFAFGGFIIWGFFHEDKFVRFESRIFARMRGFVCHRGTAQHTNNNRPDFKIITGDRIA